ncbi:type II toxin-antitoxin system VapC family toxin [Methylobacterium sp. E-045]|uniref:type II toxin-antitoxin system VapC family toxin n=1 Tax=Methylobacterium sp. E-045 TaxID=2836575 RepID=UPI001FBBE680|nr:type II toxin-antitoxin system VapC family toxin [Methylobacterium sp. E-045]MCJ2128031.1 type II toxin-antitoxin system VapC family toxin [Methylobacterium sp. E-045]
MTLFVDASALIAIITGEAEADALADVLESDPDRLCSALSLWETVAGLVRSYAFSVEAARERVRLTCEEADIRLVPIAGREFELAIDAYERFGKGRHPASLNMGDCHAYACAKAHDAVLLFKGEDFILTDIVRAG